MNPSEPSDTISKNIETLRRHYPREIIHLGIAMAGAVSAGAYSAGVMHYLLTTLDVWEKLKQQNYTRLADLIGDTSHLEADGVKEAIVEAVEKLRMDGQWMEVDMHDIRLEIMAGSSAGSLVTAIAALSLGYEQEPLTFDAMIHHDESKVGTLEEIKGSLRKDEGLYNLLFDSWVNLNDGGDIEESVFSKLLKVETEVEMQLPFSLLNGSVLDRVREHQFMKIFDGGNNAYHRREIPVYVAPDFKILYSLTLLQGIPLSVHFQQIEQDKDDPHPAHRMRRHSYMAHFALKPEKNKESLLDIRNKTASLEMINAALASGAFPLGLPPRKLLIPPAQLDSFLRVPGLENSTRVKSGVSDTYPPEQYIVDGGVLNNEPIMEVYNHLMHHLKKEAGCSRPDVKGLLLIDPFPNFEAEPDVSLDGPDTLPKVLSGLLGALRGQGLMKDISALADDQANKYLIMGMISPSRKDENGDRVKPAMATSAMEGFAGFIERDFRLHDFYLGMKNAQSFFKKFFQITSSPSFSPQESKMVQEKKRGLPDLNELEILSKGIEREGEERISPLELKKKPDTIALENADVPQQEPALKYGTIQYPHYSQDQLIRLRPLIVKRIFFLLQHRLFHSSPRQGKPIWKVSRLKWSNLIWSWTPVVMTLGALAGLWFAMGAQNFWIFFLVVLVIIGWTFYAFVQRFANACIQIIGRELHKHNLMD